MHVGQCECYSAKQSTTQLNKNNYANANTNYIYRATASDGSGTNTKGTRNDCSYIAQAVVNCSSTYVNGVNNPGTAGVSSTCSNRGYCNPENPKCVCNAAGGVYNRMASGINCATISCPVVSCS